MEYVLVWFLCGIVAAVIGANKGAGGTGFLLGVLLGPFGILIALFMRGKQKTCPFCAELVKPDARLCKHCGGSLEEITCPHCKQMVLHQADKAGLEASCPYCGGVFTYPVT